MDDSAARDAAGEAAHQPAATPQGADIPSADPAGDSPTASGQAPEEAPGEETSGGYTRDTDGSGRMPMPSPWAIAVAVLALLAFGVLVGTTVAKGHRRPTVLLADSPSSVPPATTTSTTATSTPESTGSSTSESEPEAESEPEPEPEAEESSSETEEASEAEESSKAASKPTAKETSSTTTTTKEETTASGPLPPVKHVFLIVLGEQGYDAAYGTRSKAPYLADTLRKQGELIDNYYAVSGDELANSIALISGQGPTPQTAAGCPTYEAIAPGSEGKEGQVLGSGCVYPAKTLTIANQLEKAGLTWKAYVQGLEGGPAGAAASCRHPALGEADSEHAASASDPYVTWRNPFVYFSSLTEGRSCEKNDVALEQLATDLKSSSTTPSFSYISPDPCDDGSEQPCAAGKPAGLAPLDGFLEAVVPEIERSTAYREGGLIAITFAEASQTGPNADSSGCCLTAEYPNLAGQSSTTSTTTTTTTTSTSATTAGAASPAAPAGGRVGMLLLSQYVKPNSSEVTGQYNHFSLLLSVESLFKLSALGYAGAAGLLTFESSVFTEYK